MRFCRVLGHGAELAFREAFGGDVERAVETRAGVFPGDDGRELDELALGELLAQRGVEIVGDVRWRAGKRGGEVQDEFLLFVEVRAGLELRDVVKLPFRDSGFSADGRVDIDSKGTADHEGGFELRKLLQVHRNGAFSGGVEIEAESAAHVSWVEGADASAERDAAEKTFGQEEDEARGRAGLIVLDALGTWHE